MLPHLSCSGGFHGATGRLWHKVAREWSRGRGGGALQPWVLHQYPPPPKGIGGEGGCETIRTKRRLPCLSSRPISYWWYLRCTPVQAMSHQ